MQHNGWVKLHRKVLENEMLMHDERAMLMFVKLLLLANRYGRYITGREHLARAVGMKPSTAYKVLKRLEKAEIVDSTSNNKKTTIQICNWSQYQEASNSFGSSKVAAKEQQSNTKQERRNKKEEINTIVKSDKPTSRHEQLFKIILHRLSLTDRSKYVAERQRKLKQRLATFEPKELVKAAENLARDDYMMGRDEKNTKRYATIDYLLRNDQIVDRWLNVETDGGVKNWSQDDFNNLEIPS